MFPDFLWLFLPAILLLQKAFDVTREMRPEKILNLKGSCSAIVLEYPLLGNIFM